MKKALVAAFLTLSSFTNADPPPVFLALCDRLPLPGASSLYGGGHFESSNARDCSLAGLVQKSASPVCLGRNTAQSSDVVIHSIAWSQQQQLGSWQQSGEQIKYMDAGVPQRGQEASIESTPPCLGVRSLAEGSPAALLGCDSSDPNQRWFINSTDHTLRATASSDQGLCLMWGEAPPQSGLFTIDASPSGRRQRILGFGYEIQSDSIGSGNQGLPNSTSSVPHDLTPSERTRFFAEITRGFRYCRLALGLFLRGLDASRRQIQGRWPTQMDELKAMAVESGIEGLEAQYWSPPPAWKSTGDYIGGGLASFNATFLDEFGDAVVKDLSYLESHGLNVSWWGLQNEPNFDSNVVTPQQCNDPTERIRLDALATPPLGVGYSSCYYSQCQYYDAFKAVAPKIKQAFPQALINANSARGQLGASPVALDPATLDLVDAWTWHFVGESSDRLFGSKGEAMLTYSTTKGKPSFEDEFEYQPSDFRGNWSTMNTAQMLMNWMVFAEAPTFFWIHAAKPCQNAESLGYGLALWRAPEGVNATGLCEGIEPGEFRVDPYNANAMLPFSRQVPWDSWRLNVTEDVTRPNQRVMAWETPGDAGAGGPLHANTPGGLLGVAVTNRDMSIPFETELRLADGAGRTLNGYRFSASVFNVSIGTVTLPANITVQPLEMLFFTEY